ncbi:MAG: sulfurtransferase-like selenium metabolism protein YedF, partial [Syntrophomonadaceae bacterium]|nr:sulfurtransferase-like selenium metabolism protein YedF [Syntrophomonadaceae bacterium]
MERRVDARGLACPQPVVLTKRAMEEAPHDAIVTVVDNRVAVENVSRLAASQGYRVSVTEGEGEFRLLLQPGRDRSQGDEIAGASLACLVTSRYFGSGPEELGSILMKSYLYALNEIGQLRTLVFMNSGVFLATEGSEVLDHLSALADKGVAILVCGTCLDYYGLKGQLKV